jgi:ADP-ribose diphosphatase
VPEASVPRRVRRAVIQRRLSPQGSGFLTLRRLRIRNEYEDGDLSRPYRFEMVERRGVDSVAVIPYSIRGGKLRILAKGGFRPALYFRKRPRPASKSEEWRTLVVEAVAGSLEPWYRNRAAIDRRALAELREETGFRGRRSDLEELGAGFFPSHGQCSEKVHLRAIRLDFSKGTAARGDGSVNESETWTLVFEADDLLRRCRAGEIGDPKLEIGVRRLADRLRGGSSTPILRQSAPNWEQEVPIPKGTEWSVRIRSHPLTS